jgi:hypothetical protein
MKSTALLGTGLRPLAMLNIAAHSVTFSYTVSRFLLYLIHLYYNFYRLFFSRPFLIFWSEREASDFMTVKTTTTEKSRSNNSLKIWRLDEDSGAEVERRGQRGGKLRRRQEVRLSATEGVTKGREENLDLFHKYGWAKVRCCPYYPFMWTRSMTIRVVKPLIPREQNRVVCQRTLDLCSGNQVRILVRSSSTGTKKILRLYSPTLDNTATLPQSAHERFLLSTL